MEKLTIKSGEKISKIQERFNSVFPFLKMEFFQQPPVSGLGNAKNRMIINDLPVHLVSGFKSNGEIILDEKMTVAEFEQQIEKKCGLYIQVFRKSGRIWLETTATDNWTLLQQNEEGKNLAKQLNVERENPNDHDIY